MISQIKKLIHEDKLKLALQLIQSSNNDQLWMFLMSICDSKNNLPLAENLYKLFKTNMSDNTFFIDSEYYEHIYGLADTMYVSSIYPTCDITLHDVDNIKFDSCGFNGNKLLGSCNTLTFVDQNFNGFPNIDQLTLNELCFRGLCGGTSHLGAANGKFVDKILFSFNRDIIRCGNLSCNHLTIDNNFIDNMFLDDFVPTVYDTINFYRFDQNIKKLFNNNPNAKFVYYNNYIPKSEMKSRIKYAVK